MLDYSEALAVEDDVAKGQHGSSTGKVIIGGSHTVRVPVTIITKRQKGPSSITCQGFSLDRNGWMDTRTVP
ncbi:hypothetical protein [Pasteuria penetrans]|uniref:hypothetical protein n=1 Tax=Pasteuria penetrans TaxID=86005 RepID=UPI0011EF31B1|nr:hypothetical protein [Pasteuria penetrans]